ncbi:two-component system cell cycle response regulator CtrA [Pseudoroseomonas cervicalis]|nr:two-component system cell cycle response regulator CtrA [Pseudoroseomonas cervicalis]
MHILLASTMGQNPELHRSLSQDGHGCDLAEPFVEAPSIAQHSGPYDVVVLDVADARLQAFAALREIRRRGLRMPVVIITNPISVEDEQTALNIGADDVLIRPVRAPVLIARMQAILRRGLGHTSSQLTCGNVVLDQARRTVSVDGRHVRITCREFDVLEMLMLRRGVLLTKEQFMSRAYGVEDGPDQRILDVFVCKLRRKLAAAGSAEIVRTIWGRGYVLEEPSAAELAAARARFQNGQPRMRRAHLTVEVGGSAGSSSMAVAAL